MPNSQFVISQGYELSINLPMSGGITPPDKARRGNSGRFPIAGYI